MRKAAFVLMVGLLAISLASYSQEKEAKINGTMIDGSQKIIESSTITLLRAKDSSVAKIGVADKNGTFQFEKIAEGKYFVSVSAAGHQKGYSEIFEVTPEKSSITLKTIELIPQSKSLTGVTVI